MKIGIVLYPTFGGSGVIATELGLALAKLGHEIHFITYKQPFKLERFTPNVKFHEVRVSDYPLFEYQPYEFVLASMLVDVAKFESLDLMHVHYAIPHASAAYMARQILASEGIHVPVITTLHGTDITLVGKDSSFEPVITFAINESNVVTAVSESLKAETYEYFDVKSDIQVIPNFICFEDFHPPKPELRATLATPDQKILIHISNFRKVKRVADVVKVFSKVNKVIPSKLVLVGDGPDRHRIEELCRQNEACNDIVFAGKMKETHELLAVSDLFLLTSEFESFGLVALESMGNRVPVISTNKGGIPEVMIDGETGYMCDVGDTDAMAKRAIEVLEDDKLHQKLRESAFLHAQKFELSKILPMYLDLYERTIQK